MKAIGKNGYAVFAALLLIAGCAASSLADLLPDGGSGYEMINGRLHELPPPLPGTPAAAGLAPAASAFSNQGGATVAPITGAAPSPYVSSQDFVPRPGGYVTIGGAQYVSDQVLVEFKPGVSDADIQAVMRQYGLHHVKKHKYTDWHLITLPAGAKVADVVAELNKDPRVKEADLNGVLRSGSVTCTDSYFTDGTQWNLSQIDMPDAWNITTGNSGTIIAVLDSGIDTTHPNLAGKITTYSDGTLEGFAAADRENTTATYPFEDNLGHGTAVSGIAAALTTFSPDSATGIAGVDPLSPILPVKVFDSTGYGSEEDFLCGVDDVIDVPGVKVINFSGYYPNEISTGESTLESGVEAACNAGILVVTIMGNFQEGGQINFPDTTVCYPGALWNAMAVSATDEEDQWASSYSIINSPGSTENSVAAPGGLNYTGTDSVEVPWLDGIWEPNDGTSLAAPHVAGLAGLCLSEFPSMTWYDLKSHIEDTADDVNSSTYPGYDDYLGWGRINADTAVGSQSYSASFTYQGGGVPLVTVPVWDSQLSQTDVNSDLSILFGSSVTKALWWDPTVANTSGGEGAYVSYGSTDYPAAPEDPNEPRMGPGRGYFIAPTSTFTTPTWYGAAAFTNSSHPCVVHLKVGWNLIGTPGFNNVTWDTSTIQVRYQDPGTPTVPTTYMAVTASIADSSTIVSPDIYSVDPNTGDETLISNGGTLTPGTGYWFLAGVECDLLLPSS